MADFNWIPDQGVTERPTFDVNKVRFGDGYEQRSVNGINSTRQIWDMKFTLRTKTEILAIDAFIKARKGVTSFTWTTPKGETLRFKCEIFSSSGNHDNDWNAAATFEQVHET